MKYFDNYSPVILDYVIPILLIYIRHIYITLYLTHSFAAQVSAIPVVDDNDSLLDIYSRRLVYILCECSFPTIGIASVSCHYFAVT